MKLKFRFTCWLLFIVSLLTCPVFGRTLPHYDSIAITKYDTLTKFHLVKSGQTLASIAKMYHCPIGKLVSLNKLNTKEYRVKIGEKIMVPYIKKTVTMKYMMPSTDGGMVPPKPIEKKEVKELENNDDTPNLPKESNFPQKDTTPLTETKIEEEVMADTIRVTDDSTPLQIEEISKETNDIKWVQDSVKKEEYASAIAATNDTVLIFSTNDIDTLKKDQKKLPAIQKSSKQQKESTKPGGNTKQASSMSVLQNEVEKISLDTAMVFKAKDLKPVHVNEKVRKNKAQAGVEVSEIAKQKASFYLARAMKAIDIKDFKAAQTYTKKALEINPNYCEAWMLHADLNTTFGYFDKAIKDYSQAIIANKNMVQAYYNRGVIYLKMADLDKAYADFNRAIRLDSTYIVAIGGRASIRIYKKEYIDAIADYTSIINLNKYFSPAYKARGVARLEIGDYTEAIADFSEFLKNSPSDAYVYYQKGMAELKTGKMYDSCLDFLKASDLGSLEAKAAIKKHCD
jgi:tetratricopeptide (TPR) repeat protein